MNNHSSVRFTRSRAPTFGGPRLLEARVPKQEMQIKPLNIHVEIQKTLLKESVKKEPSSSLYFCLFMAYAFFLFGSITICCIILTSGNFGSLVELFVKHSEIISKLQNTRKSCYYLLTSVLECLVLAIVGMVWSLIVLILTFKHRCYLSFLVVQSIVLIATEIFGFLSVQGSCPSMVAKALQKAKPDFTLPQSATYYLGVLFVLNLVSLLIYGRWAYSKIRETEQAKKPITSEP